VAFGSQEGRSVTAQELQLARLTKELSDLTAELANMKANQYHLSISYNNLVIENARLSTEVRSYKNLYREGHLVIGADYRYNPKARNWNSSPGIAQLRHIIAEAEPRFCRNLMDFGQYLRELRMISIEPAAQADTEPCWNNIWFSGLDAVSLYGFIARNKPRCYWEIGSGNSTKFASRAIRDHHLETKIVSIDPQPRDEIDAICDRIIRQPLETVNVELFTRFEPTDILLVDSSHRSLQNSDVTVFFTEILPILPSGILFGLHDIFLPADYSDDYIPRFYNEQYLLAAYLLGGAGGDRIELANSYVSFDRVLSSPVGSLFAEPAMFGIEPCGGMFWMTKA
jgi:Methyltransferase domain